MSDRSAAATLCLILAAAGLGGAAIAQPEPPAQPQFDPQTLHVQVLLDRAGFSPGVLDGKTGQSLEDAIKGFQMARDLKVTGELDVPTRALLFADRAPAVRSLKLDAGDIQGKFVLPFPREPEAQARLTWLGYRNGLEKLAEKFHTTPDTIIALNSPGARLAPGAALKLPYVLPWSRAYEGSITPDDRQMLSDLNADAAAPKGDRVVVDKSDRVLRVYDGERLIAQFPATMGSEKDPLPLGNWTIKGVAYMPPFHYQPDLFWDVSDAKDDHRLPPGPNGPVGVAWLDLSKEHYGIHGTPEPQTIGRAESHGCIRLTNWDVARLSLMVAPGTRAVFQA